MQSTSLRSWLWIGICFFILSSCSLLQKALKSPEVKFREVVVSDISITGAQLNLTLEIFNPNSVDLDIDEVDYQLKLNAKPLSAGAIHTPTHLPSQKTVQVIVPVHVDFNRVFESLTEAFQRPKTKYSVDGSAKLGFLNVPFHSEGDIDWKK